MGDMGDLFRAKDEAYKQLKERHRKDAPELLKNAGIPFESRNLGAHLVVYGISEKIDFWPSTGHWTLKSGNLIKRSHGIKCLIDYIQKKAKN